MQNVSEYMLVLALCLVVFSCFDVSKETIQYRDSVGNTVEESPCESRGCSKWISV